MKYLKKLLLGMMITTICLVNVANAGLISSWSLNGHHEDSTGNGHDGSGSSLPGFIADASGSGYGESASFNNNYIALNQSFSGEGSLSELSVSAWFKTTATGDPQRHSNWALLDFDRSEFFNLFVTVKGAIGFSTHSASGIDDMVSSISALNDGNWHHVAVTYGNSEGKNIYIDGVLDSAVASMGAMGSSDTRYGFIGDGSEARIFDGKRNKLYYDGLISNVNLWDNALSASEVRASASEVRAEVPEPSTLAIFALGIIGLATRRFKRNS